MFGDYNIRSLFSKGALFCCLLLALSSFCVSCSETDEQEGEYDNWQQRNEAYIEKLASSSMKRILTYAKENTVSSNKISDYVYVEELESGLGDVSPLFTDTVRFAYRGRYIPTATYTDGLVFDQSYVGDFDWNTIGAYSSVTSANIEGVTTALMNMHVGDRWRVYVPYGLGYGTSSSSTGIMAYSTLIFDIALVDFWHPGEKRPAFRARQK